MDIGSIVSRFQLIGTTVKKIQVTNDFVTLPDAVDVKRIIDVDYVIEGIERNEEDESLFGTILLSIHVTIRHQKRKLDIKCDVQGAFHAPHEMDNDTFQKMMTTNGCASIYSISRAIIISVSSQLLLHGCIYLPMINVFKLNEEKQKKINIK